MLRSKEEISLSSFKGGALEELFRSAVGKVVENILDPNTATKPVREVRIVVKFQPNKDRSAAAIEAQVDTKLAGHEPVSSTVFFDADGQRFVAFEHDPRQGSIFDNAS